MTDIPLLDHELAEDELSWVRGIYAAFDAERGRHANPKDALRAVLERPEHRLGGKPVDFSGPVAWRFGANQHGRFAAAVFLPRVELHTHRKSRTDQFPMYTIGEAEGFSLDANGNPELTPIAGGDHCHNSPGAPHAFLPKVGKPIPDNWEIAFVAITPRNLQEDTQSVSPEVKAAYTRITGYEAPTWV